MKRWMVLGSGALLGAGVALSLLGGIADLSERARASTRFFYHETRRVLGTNGADAIDVRAVNAVHHRAEPSGFSCGSRRVVVRSIHVEGKGGDDTLPIVSASFFPHTPRPKSTFSVPKGTTCCREKGGRRISVGTRVTTRSRAGAGVVTYIGLGGGADTVVWRYGDGALQGVDGGSGTDLLRATGRGPGTVESLPARQGRAHRLWSEGGEPGAGPRPTGSRYKGARRRRLRPAWPSTMICPGWD